MKAPSAWLPLVLLALICAGCAQEQPGPEKRSAVVDVVTQRTAVEAGQKAKATINKVQAQRQRDFEDALGDKK